MGNWRRWFGPMGKVGVFAAAQANVQGTFSMHYHRQSG